jgi:hypothetical protein
MALSEAPAPSRANAAVAGNEVSTPPSAVQIPADNFGRLVARELIRDIGRPAAVTLKNALAIELDEMIRFNRTEGR